MCGWPRPYHLEPLLHGSCPLEVFGGGFDVPVDCLFRQVDHVRGEQRFSVLLEVGLIGVHHAVQPWQQLLGTVVGVQDNWNAICGSNTSDVVSCGDSTGDRSLLLVILDPLCKFSPCSCI